MSADGRSPPEPLDRVTYLPIDRSRAAEKVFAPWDPRAGKPRGGMKLGETPVFVTDGAMPGLDAQAVARACDAVVAGRGVYPALLVLGRVGPDDLPALLAATESEEVRVRWERLWVISPFLARLSRSEEGGKKLVSSLLEDLGAVHLLSKFGEQNNPAVKRLFARLHDPLLSGLLQALHDDRFDLRRANLISSIISAIETQEAPLRKCLPETLSEAEQGALFDMLYIRPTPQKHKTLRSRVLRDRLMQMRR